MNLIDFGGTKLKVNVTLDVYGNNRVNTIIIETEPLLNLADMLTIGRGLTLLIQEVKGQGHYGLIWQ